MADWKRLAWAAAVGAAALGCGGTEGQEGGSGGSGGTAGIVEPSCSVDDDCTFEEICLEGHCAALCSRHEECRFNEYCVESIRGARVCSTLPDREECEKDDDCPGDEVCGNGACIPGSIEEGCLSVAECYPHGAYCAAAGTTTACFPMTCGAPENDCERCHLGPNGGAAKPGGPLLFYPQQSGACFEDAELCLPGVAPFVCTFSFLAFDPDGDLPTNDLDTHVRFVGPEGGVLPTFGTTRSDAAGYPRFTFRACYPNRGDGKVEGAVYVFDVGLRVSQTLCVEGELR